MAEISFIQSSFLGGEWSKASQGRITDPRYRTALNVCLNTIPVVENSAWRRVGTRMGQLTRGGGLAKMLNYTDTDSTKYEVELTDGHIRFFQTGKLQAEQSSVQRVSNISAANPAVVTVGDTSLWATGDQVRFVFLDQVSATAMPLLTGRTFLIDVVTATTVWIRDAVTTQVVDGTLLGWSASLNVNLERIIDLSSPYTAALFPSTNMIQSDQAALLLNGTVQPQALTLSSVAAVDFTDGPYLDPFPNSNITPDNVNGVVNLVLSFGAYNSAQAYRLGDYVEASSIGYVSLQNVNQGNTPASSPTWWALALPSVVVNNGAGFVPQDAGRHIRLFSEPPLWNIGTDYSIGNVVTLVTNNSYWVAIAAITHAAAASNGVSPVQPGVDVTMWAPAAGVAQWTWGEVVTTSVTSAIPGIIDPTTALSRIGDMGINGGLAALFNGNTFEVGAEGARVENGSGYGGLQFAAAQQIRFAKAYPTTDVGFANSSGSNWSPIITGVTLNLRAKHTLPASMSDGTNLGTVSFTNSINPGVKTITSSDATTAWEYAWIEVIAVDAANVDASEFQFYSPSAAASGAGVTVQLIGPPLLYTSAIRTWRFGAYGGPDNVWPKVGVYHEGRFGLAGAYPGRFDFSEPNQPYVFSPTGPDGTVGDGNAFSYTLNSKEHNDILWMRSDLLGVLLGTSGGEVLLHASANGDKLTATSIQGLPVTSFGSTPIEPRQTRMTSVFVHKNRQMILEFLKDAYSGRFAGTELTEFIHHRTENLIEDIAYTDTKNPIVWIRTADGKLTGLTYRRIALLAHMPPDLLAGHSHELGHGHKIVDIREAVALDGTTDTIVLVTQDPVTNLCYVEYLGLQAKESDTIFQAQYVDGAIIPSSAVTSGANVVLNGLWARNGDSVDVWAAGLDCGTFTVQNGSVTVPYGSAGGLFTARYLTELAGKQMDFGDIGVALDNGSVFPCVVGSSYRSRGQILRPTLPDETGAQAGPGLGEIRRQHQYGILLHNAQGVSVGTDFEHLRPMIFHTVPQGRRAITPTELFSGIHTDVLDDESSYDGMTCWEISRPYPAAVLAFGAYIETQDK